MRVNKTDKDTLFICKLMKTQNNHQSWDKFRKDLNYKLNSENIRPKFLQFMELYLKEIFWTPLEILYLWKLKFFREYFYLFLLEDFSLVLGRKISQTLQTGNILQVLYFSLELMPLQSLWVLLQLPFLYKGLFF